MSIALTHGDWLQLLLHFASLSLLAVGGAITVVPDMHRFLVDQKMWISDPQFSASIAIAQAAPGPNVLFVGLMGWHVGLNAAGVPGALLGFALTLAGVIIPSCTLTWAATRWAHRNRERLAVRAFKQGMAPVVLALLIATGWLLATSTGYDLSHWPLWAVTVASTLLVWKTRIHLLWLLGAGGLLGAMGWV